MTKFILSIIFAATLAPIAQARDFFWEPGRNEHCSQYDHNPRSCEAFGSCYYDRRTRSCEDGNRTNRCSDIYDPDQCDWTRGCSFDEYDWRCRSDRGSERRCQNIYSSSICQETRGCEWNRWDELCQERRRVECRDFDHSPRSCERQRGCWYDYDWRECVRD